jgi:hypothetical protein
MSCAIIMIKVGGVSDGASMIMVPAGAWAYTVTANCRGLVALNRFICKRGLQV